MKPNKYITVLCLLFSVFVSNAEGVDALFDTANVAYSKTEYSKAIQYYDSILKLGFESPELYYNLGNAYFKEGKIGWSILNYEKSLKLNPNNEDVENNLKIAYDKTEDKLDVQSGFNFKRKILNLFSERVWSLLCIVLFFFSFTFFIIYILSYKSGLKQLGFFGGALLLIFSVGLYVLSYQKKKYLLSDIEAVIMNPSVSVNSSPDEKGTRLFILHEGAKVYVGEKEGEWVEVKLNETKTGWVRINAIEFI